MTKRDAAWITCGLALGAVTWVVTLFGFGMRTHAPELMLAGAILAYLTAKIVHFGKSRL